MSFDKEQNALVIDGGLMLDAGRAAYRMFVNITYNDAFNIKRKFRKPI